MFEFKFKGALKQSDFKSVTPPGSAPGTIVAPPDAREPVITTFAYGQSAFVEGTIESLDQIEELLSSWPVTWINVTGLGNVKRLKEIGKILNIHLLSLEDVVNQHQRPKVEDYDSNLFVVMKMLEVRDEVLCSEQLSLFIGDRFVVTFQADEGDCLEHIRERIRKGKNRIRSTGPDYLGYAILDAVVDAYFPVLEEYGERLEQLEDKILDSPGKGLVAELHQIKRDLLILRRNIWPMREALNSLIRDSYPVITEDTRVYLRDCYDHAVRIIDLIENFRQIAADLMDVYLSMASNKMNEVMKVLTVISTIFIPPTFVAGVYGMNFNTAVSPWNMPELNSQFGYPMCLLIMTLITTCVILFLFSRGWLTGD